MVRKVACQGKCRAENEPAPLGGYGGPDASTKDTKQSFRNDRFYARIIDPEWHISAQCDQPAASTGHDNVLTLDHW